MGSSFQTLALALPTVLLLSHCANLDCPAGQEAIGNSCVCSGTQDLPIQGVCVAGVCDADGCPCTFEGIIAAIAVGGSRTLDCTDDAAPVAAEDTIVIDNDVILDGQGHLTVQGNGTFHVFEARSSTSELIGTTITGGDSGIAVENDANLTLTDCVVRENTSVTAAGGGLSNDGRLTLVDTTVENNIAKVGSGGGIYNAPSGMLTLSRSTIRNNQSEVGPGGGIRNTRGVVEIDDSEISDNHVTTPTCPRPPNCANGGGISNENGAIEIAEGLIQGNTTRWHGGGLASEGSDATVSITGSTVSGNKTIGNGDDNKGGGIWCTGGAVVSTRTTWSNNEAAKSGGAFYVEGTGASLLLEQSTVSNNLAAVVGGGVRVYLNASATIINSTIFGNESLGGGGDGIHIQHGATATIKSSTISNNSADGVSNISGTLTLAQTIIEDSCVDSAPTVSLGYNIESPGDTCGLDQPSDKLDVSSADLRLADALEDNGGDTLTLLLARPSVALDAFIGSCDQTEDQRGVTRAQGAGCDIGAVELE